MIALAPHLAEQTSPRAVPVFSIAAVARNGVIGRADGSLPWSAPADLRHFKIVTMNCVLIAGRTTADTLPDLPGRDLVILSRSSAASAGIVRSPHEAIEVAQGLANRNRRSAIAVVGGGEVYRALLHRISESYLSRIDAEVDGEATFPVAEHDALPWSQKTIIGTFEASIDHIAVEGQFEHLTL